MNQFNDMSDFFHPDELDVALVADNHLFSNGPDLYDEQFNGELFDDNLFNRLHDTMHSPRLADMSMSFSGDLAPEPPVLPSSDVECFDLNTRNDFDIGNDLTNFAPLPDQSILQPIPQQADGFGLDVEFDQSLPQLPLLPGSTTTPAALLNNDLSRSQIVPAPVTTPDGLFMWSSMGTNDLIQMPVDQQQQQQQQWSAFANQQTQLSQPQPTIAQTQYMQALQQFQFAQNQLAQSMQSSFQSPVNAQSPPDQQSPLNQQSPKTFQQAQNSPPLHQYVEPAQCVQASRQESPQAALSPAISPETVDTSPTTKTLQGKQQEGSGDLPRPRKARKNRTAQNARTTESEHGESSSQASEQRFHGLEFTSLQHAEATMATRYVGTDWQAPSPDRTVPQTNEARARWVLEMLDAFQDTSKCKDNKEGFSFLKRWNKTGYYDVQQMEKVCWQMCEIAERLHAHGPTATNVYCQDALKKLYASRSLTFEQRIVSICDMLRLSKFVCDGLMKGEGIEALVGAPKQKISGAKTMMVQNKKRQGWLITGRKSDPNHKNDESVEGDEEDLPAPTQHKPKGKAKRSAPAAKPRALTDARSRHISPESSDDEDESFARRQSLTNAIDDDMNEADDNMDEYYMPSGSPPTSAPTSPTLSDASSGMSSPPVSLLAPPAMTESSHVRANRTLKRGSKDLEEAIPPRANPKLPESWTIDSTDHEDDSVDDDEQDEDSGLSEPEYTPSPPPSPIRKRKRDTISKRGMTQRRDAEVDPSSSEQSDESGSDESGSDEEPAPPAKRAKATNMRGKKVNNKPARKSATPASAAENTSARQVRPKRNSTGRSSLKGRPWKMS